MPPAFPLHPDGALFFFFPFLLLLLFLFIFFFFFFSLRAACEPLRVTATNGNVASNARGIQAINKRNSGEIITGTRDKHRYEGDKNHFVCRNRVR